MSSGDRASSFSPDIATPSGKDRGGENFPVGSLLIRASLRRHVHAFYRFARMADDIADNPALPAAEKIHRLGLMRTILLDPARTDVLVAAAMRDSLLETGISSVHCTDLLVAFRQDATQQRYPTWADLLRYCRYSASPVGRFFLDLHGESLGARESADALCDALQVLNHLQDCKADYREMDRVYIPLDHFEGEGIGVEVLSAAESSPALRRMLDRVLDETDELIAKARQLPARVRDFRLRTECAIIVLIAEKLAMELRDRDPLAERVKLDWIAKIGCVLGGIAWSISIALGWRK